MYVQRGEGRGGEGRGGGGEGRGGESTRTTFLHSSPHNLAHVLHSYILPHITYTAYHHFYPCVFLCVPVTHLYADISVTTMSLMYCVLLHRVLLCVCRAPLAVYV